MAQLDYVESLVREVYAKPTPSTPSESLRGPLFFRKDQGLLILEDNEAAAYARVVARLQEEHGKRGDISQRMLEKYVQDVLFSALFPAVDSQAADVFEKRLADAMRALREQLKKAPGDYTCLIPVLGLDEEGLPGSIGGVRLTRMTTARVHQLAAVDNIEVAEKRKASKHRLTKWLKDDGILGQPVAVVAVRARDLEAAHGLARRRAQEIVDILNFFADEVTDGPGWVYLAGEAAREVYETVIAGPDGSMTANSSLEGPFAPVSLKRLRSTPALQPSLRRLDGLLRQDPRSEMAQLLITSARWAGRASAEHVREQAFLLYTIALETLMLPDSDSELNYRLRLRAARLLANSLAERERYKRMVRDLYGIRSKIVHSGLLTINDGDLGRLRFVTKRCIVRALLHRRVRQLNTRKEWASWLNQDVFR